MRMTAGLCAVSYDFWRPNGAEPHKLQIASGAINEFFQR